MQIVPLTLKQANAIVEELHRNHKPARGCRFAIGLRDDAGALRGCAIVGRPVARMIDFSTVCEVTRVATDGVPNGCSKLLGACARIAREMGFAAIQPYTLPAEGGASLRGAGWTYGGETGGGEWARKLRPRQTELPCVKSRWSKVLRKC